MLEEISLAYPVQTFLAVGRIVDNLSAVLLAVPLEHLALDLGLDGFALFGDGPVRVRNLLSPPRSTNMVLKLALGCVNSSLRPIHAT